MDIKYDLGSYTRVLKLASTPSWEEFSRIALIAGAGIVLIGFIGYIIFTIMNTLPGLF
jgi:protein transport protein SEC61 subunit gamma and related proteins